MKTVSILMTLLAAGLLVACEPEQQAAVAELPPAEVDVAQPLKHQITEWEEFTGRFEAVERVDVRSRVTGYIMEKKFRDGQVVDKGDVLFIIDPRPFRYEVQRYQAQHTLAEKEYTRATGLREKQAISQEDLDRRFQELKVAEAELNEARLQLAFTQVTAPIAGKMSDAFLDIGNLVRADDTILSRVVSIDPIHFRFEASQGQLLKYIRLDRSGQRPSSNRVPNPIFIKLQDETVFMHPGRMDFVDNIVDAGTGTIQGRALVQNKDSIIYPGLFGRARLMGRSNFDVLLLPEKAINTDQNKKFVYLVDTDNKVTRTYITPGAVLDNGYVIIENGLTADDQVVINGIQRITATGQTVTPNLSPLTWVETGTMPDMTNMPSLQAMENKQTDASAAESPSQQDSK